MKKLKIKLETLGIIFVIVLSSITPILLTNYGTTNEDSKEDTQNNLLDDITNPGDLLDDLPDNLQNLSNIINPQQESQDIINISFDGEYYRIEECKKHKLDDSVLFDFYQLGKPAEISDIVEINYNREIISNYHIIFEKEIGDLISDSIQKTLKSYTELTNYYNFDISDNVLNNIQSNLEENVNSNDFLVCIEWEFHNGLKFSTYGIYDSIKSRYIFDPILNSFPKSFLSEERTVNVFSNNTILSGVTGTISRTIILYTYVLFVRVDWLRIVYNLDYRYAVTPVANGEIIQTFDWTFSATKTLLDLIGIIDQYFVLPEYQLPYIKFYFDGSLKAERNHPKTETSAQSASVSCSFSKSCNQYASVDTSYVAFKFKYGFKYLLSETLLESTGSSSNADTVTGVSPIQFQSIYTSATDIILGVDFTITVKIKNPNDYKSRCTLSVNTDSLKREGEEVLKIKEGTSSSFTENFNPDQEKTFSFTFTPVLGDLITVQFDCSLRIYEKYYYIDQHELKISSQTELGPTRSNSDTIDIDINDEVPAFALDKGDVSLLNYDREFFEPGDDIVIKIEDLENIGKLTALSLDIEVYLVGESTPITSYTTSDVVSGAKFDVQFPSFSLTSFGNLPATKGFYFKFLYTWFGHLTPLDVDIFDEDPIQISFDLIHPHIDFVIEDSGDFSDRTVDAELELSYEGNILSSFSYDIDTYKRKLNMDPTISLSNFFINIIRAVERGAEGTIQKTTTAKLAQLLGKLSTKYKKAEKLSKFQKWGAVVLADLAGFGYYIAVASQPNEWQEPYQINIKDGEIDYEPTIDSTQLVGFEIDKKPLLEGAAGNLLLAAFLPSIFCNAFTRASYKFKITVDLVDNYGNVRTFEKLTDSYEQGEVCVGKINGINVFKELLGFKDMFICQGTTFLVFAAIYAVLAALPWFSANFMRPAIVCLALGLLYVALAELLLTIICVYLVIDPEQENDDISEIELTNFANNSALGIGNNFIESVYDIQESSEELTSKVWDQTNSMANGEDVDYTLDESFESFGNATVGFGRILDLYSQEIEGTDMGSINTVQLNNSFDETVSLINNTGVTPVIKSLGKDVGIREDFLDSIEKPGLVYGNPEPLKNASFFTGYCVNHTVNITGHIRALSDVSEYNAINYMAEKEGIEPSNINNQDLDLLEQYRSDIESLLEQENNESVLAKCDLLEITVDQIISNTHNTSIIGYKTYALLTKDHILGMNAFAPSIFSDKNYYEIGDNIEFSTEIYNMAYLNDSYYIYVEDTPSFINLNYDTLISVDSTDKSDTIIQQFTIPFDWRISAGIYNITILVDSVRFEKTRKITLSFEILPFHNTTILQQQSQIALKPGENEILEYQVRNFGNIVEYFKINVTGINSTWFDINSDFIIVESGAIISFPINISIPYSNTISPNNFTIETTFEGYFLETYTCELTILPFYDFYLEYIPLDNTALIPGESATSFLFIENLGNTPIYVNINVTDKEIQKWFNISSPIQLQVGEWINLSCYLTPERIYSTAPGLYNFSLYVNIMEDPNVFNIINDSFIVLEFFDSEIFVVNSSIDAEIGDSVDYLFNVTNLGNTISEFSLDSFLWNTSIVNNWTTIIKSYLILNPGESDILIINVNVPYFWNNMDSIHAICLVQINCLNESTIKPMNVSLTIESTPKNMIHFLINRINRLYIDIDQATDSCRKYLILKTLNSSVRLLNTSLHHFSMNNFKISVILDIFSRSKLQFIGLLSDCSNFYKFFNVSFIKYLKTELLDCQDQISLLIGITINIALNKKVGTEISLIQIKNNALFRILDTYDIKKCVRLHINIKLFLLDKSYSFLYIHAVFNNSKCFQATVDYLSTKYTRFLYKLNKFHCRGLIPNDCYNEMLDTISEIQADLLNLTL